jgi:EAL domain-containing protein (putative c-di-GMP-specific phosphodiesterase class I)
LVERGDLDSQLVLHYQPKLGVSDRRLAGFEALLRWAHPEDGLVQPGVFVPVLEQTGLIVDVGRWAIERALADYCAWQAEGLAPPPVAVNVSPRQLGRGQFVRMVMEALARAGCDAAALELELTESVVMRKIESVVPMLQELQAMGVHVAIDDFGTGYSSLAYLAKLPVRALKVDRSFIQTMNDSAESMSLVSSIVGLAQSLNLTVVAEGVETAEQAELLAAMRCDEMQGFLFSRPVDACAIRAMLLERRSLDRRPGGSGPDQARGAPRSPPPAAQCSDR